MTDVSWPEIVALAVVVVLFIAMLWRADHNDVKRKREREEMRRHLRE